MRPVFFHIRSQCAEKSKKSAKKAQNFLYLSRNFDGFALAKRQTVCYNKEENCMRKERLL